MFIGKGTETFNSYNALQSNINIEGYKRVIIMINQGPVHTTPEKFENAAWFLRLGFPSTVIRHENGAFRKRSSNRRNLKTPALRFSAAGKHFENVDVTIIMWVSRPSFPQTQIQIKWPVIVAFQISPA